MVEVGKVRLSGIVPVARLTIHMFYLIVFHNRFLALAGKWAVPLRNGRGGRLIVSGVEPLLEAVCELPGPAPSQGAPGAPTNLRQNTPERRKSCSSNETLLY